MILLNSAHICINNELPNRVIIAGSRTFDDYDSLVYLVDSTLATLGVDSNSTEIVSGTAKGADSLGEKYANDRGIKIKQFPALWKRYGKSAGMIRNREMLEYINQDGYNGVVLAFWDGKSRGTYNTIQQGKKMGLLVEVFEYNTTTDYPELHEGVKKLGNNFEFDFTNDDPEDLVALTETTIKKSSFYGNTVYYGYTFNKNSGRDDKNLFLSFLKSSSDTNNDIQLMLQNCVDKFCSAVSHIDFGCLITIPSQSPTNTMMKNMITSNLSIKNVCSLSKKPSYEIEVDYEELKKSYKRDDYDSLVKDVKTNIERVKQSGEEFELKKVLNRYRRYVKQLFNIGNVNIDLEATSDILILDDIKNTGKSLKDAISLIRESGYIGNIHLVTLINR